MTLGWDAECLQERKPQNGRSARNRCKLNSQQEIFHSGESLFGDLTFPDSDF
jgi:hypothetical protein